MASYKPAAGLGAFAVTCLWTARAFATPTFPLAIANFAMGPPPSCSVCHVGPQQRGTVNTGFGVAMRSRGLVAFDESSLVVALGVSESERVDSDDDGIIDIDELRAGTDPNAQPGESDTTITPIYGCAASSQRGAGALWLVSALVTAMLLARRRARRS